MEELHRQRLDRLSQALKEEGLTQMIVSDPLAVWYFTGVDVQPGERLFALYARADGGHKLILNKLFTVACTGLEEVWMTDTDDTIGILAQAVDPAADMGIDKNWPARFLLALMERNPGVRYVNSSGCVDRIRAVKDEDEQEKMRAASRINDACMEAAAAYLREGLTEKEVSDYITKLYRDAGCEGLSFGTIVSYGAHAADPHHEPDNTALKKGDCIVIDMGCRKDRYCSDMTRTFFCGEPEPEYAAIHDPPRRPLLRHRPRRQGAHRGGRLRPILYPPSGPLHRAGGPRVRRRQLRQHRHGKSRNDLFRGTGRVPARQVRRPRGGPGAGHGRRL